jgi:hypothetical protein
MAWVHGDGNKTNHIAVAQQPAEFAPTSLISKYKHQPEFVDKDRTKV